MNKFVLLLIITTVFISGCIFDKNNGSTPVKQDIIPQTNLPVGFTYMGTHETSVSIGGVSLVATEGVYRNAGEDVYIQVVRNDRPEALITQYKKQYKDVNYNPFEDISFNGHEATKVTDYTVIDGKQSPRYTVVWAKEKNMIIVGSSGNPQTVIALATATGY